MTTAIRLNPDAGPGDATRPARHCYSVFGAMLDSDLEFPELEPARREGRSSWRLLVANSIPPAAGAVLLGRRELGAESYSLWQTPRGLRLEYSHAGVFDLSADGTTVVWYRRAALQELVRSIVLGPVLALSLELSGLFCLHGSAVAINNEAVVFLGPKYHGKSTLATALTAAGAQLIGDDLIAVTPGLPAMVRPGVPSVRLWADSAGALPLGALCRNLVPGIKTTASGFAGHAHTRGEVRLGALYILEPVTKHEGPACTRRRLSSAAAAIGLAHQTKLADALIGMVAAGTQLAAAARLAVNVPVWAIAPVRDLARLPEVVEQIMHWHGHSRA